MGKALAGNASVADVHKIAVSSDQTEGFDRRRVLGPGDVVALLAAERLVARVCRVGIHNTARVALRRADLGRAVAELQATPALHADEVAGTKDT